MPTGDNAAGGALRGGPLAGWFGVGPLSGLPAAAPSTPSRGAAGGTCIPDWAPWRVASSASSGSICRTWTVGVSQRAPGVVASPNRPADGLVDAGGPDAGPLPVASAASAGTVSLTGRRGAGGTWIGEGAGNGVGGAWAGAVTGGGAGRPGAGAVSAGGEDWPGPVVVDRATVVAPSCGRQEVVRTARETVGPVSAARSEVPPEDPAPPGADEGGGPTGCTAGGGVSPLGVGRPGVWLLAAPGVPDAVSAGAGAASPR